MRLAVAALALLTGCSCGSTVQQSQVQPYRVPPVSYLKLSVEVSAGGHRGWGVPLQGGRIITASHLSMKDSIIYWRSQWEEGTAELIKLDEKKDLALLRTDKVISQTLTISDNRPEVGEELYWVIHMEDRSASWARGWYLGPDMGFYKVDGWYHPGTSGAPVLRADGTVVGIMVAGDNWSCPTRWFDFLKLDREEQDACLYKKTLFPVSAIVSPLVGWE